MNVSINNSQYSSFAYSSSGNRPVNREPRQPLVIEGEKLSSHTERAQRTAAPSESLSPQAASEANQQRQQSQLEAKPVQDNEQLFGAKPVIPARAPLAVFAAITQPSLKLGASVDTFA
ncbi:MAG TPA: hypothetical protein VIC26_08880 [Marinagarivorans sp.]